MTEGPPMQRRSLLPLLLLGAVVLLVPALLADEVVAQSGTGTLKVIVVSDTAPPQPIRGATVMIDGKAHTNQTGKGGTVTITGVRAGVHNVRVEADRYVGQQLNVSVAAGATREVTFQLRRAPPPVTSELLASAAIGLAVIVAFGWVFAYRQSRANAPVDLPESFPPLPVIGAAKEKTAAGPTKVAADAAGAPAKDGAAPTPSAASPTAPAPAPAAGAPATASSPGLWAAPPRAQTPSPPAPPAPTPTPAPSPAPPAQQPAPTPQPPAPAAPVTASVQPPQPPSPAPVMAPAPPPAPAPAPDQPPAVPPTPHYAPVPHVTPPGAMPAPPQPIPITGPPGARPGRKEELSEVELLVASLGATIPESTGAPARKAAAPLTLPSLGSSRTGSGTRDSATCPNCAADIKPSWSSCPFCDYRLRPDAPGGDGGGAAGGGPAGTTGRGSGGSMPGSGPAVRPLPAAGGAPGPEAEPFVVKEVLLIYEDGRLIAHTSTEEEEGLDKEIMGSMLVAIRNFVKDSFQTKGGLNTFSFDRYSVVLEASQHLFLATVLEGRMPAGIQEELQEVVQRIEGIYAGPLQHWSGNVRPFQDVRQQLAPLFLLHRRYQIREPKPEVVVKSAVEFFQGYVRMKVAAVNDTKHVVTDAELKLTYDRTRLRLDRVDPPSGQEGSLVLLGNVRPAERKTVAFYLDPLICQESFVDGTLSFHDHEGKLHHVDMKRRPVDVVCPIFYTPETVNAAVLKRIIGQSTEKDKRVLKIPPTVPVARAYDHAKSVIQRHDVRFVREFAEQRPIPLHEAWYYGRVRDTHEEIAIRTTARSDTNTLEIFIACSNLASLTGLQAELNHLLGQLIEGAEQSTDPLIRRRIDATPVLLETWTGQDDAPQA